MHICHVVIQHAHTGKQCNNSHSFADILKQCFVCVYVCVIVCSYVYMCLGVCICLCMFFMWLRVCLFVCIMCVCVCMYICMFASMLLKKNGTNFETFRIVYDTKTSVVGWDGMYLVCSCQSL